MASYEPLKSQDFKTKLAMYFVITALAIYTIDTCQSKYTAQQNEGRTKTAKRALKL